MNTIDVRFFEFYINPTVEKVFRDINENEKRRRIHILENTAEELDKSSDAYQLMLIVIEMSKEYLHGKKQQHN